MTRSTGHGFNTFCISVFLFSVFFTVQGNSCPSSWRFLDGSCYFFSNQTATWFKARERCKEAGGDLVIVSSDAENAFIVSHYSSLSCLTEGAWLGLRRHPNNVLRWIWLDDLETEIKFTKWHRKEPMNDRLDKNCTEIHPTKSIYWYGSECDVQGCYICVKDANECNNKDVCSGQPCSNIPRSYRCLCGNGYLTTEDGTNCEDIDECKQQHGGCPHVCINTPGSYFCHCKDGYITENNGTICRPRFFEFTHESAREKGMTTRAAGIRRTNETQVTKPPKQETTKGNEQQAGSSDETLEEPSASPLASFGVLFTMAIPLCFIVCFLILCYLKGPGKDKSEKEVGISGRLIESVSPFLDTAFMDPATNTKGKTKGKKTTAMTTNGTFGEDEPMV